MEASPNHPYLSESSGKVEPSMPTSYVMPSTPYIGQHAVAWMPHYVNSSPVFFQLYAPVSAVHGTTYYPQQFVYGNAPRNVDVYGPGMHPASECNNCEPKTVASHQHEVMPTVAEQQLLRYSQIPRQFHNTETSGKIHRVASFSHQEGGIESNYVNPKRDVCRYGSADSGFADSALSLSSSSATWSGDESSLDDSDSSDTRNNRRYSATVSEVFFENNEELREEQEEYWTLNDDNVYWCKQRQSPPSRFVCSAIANQVDYYLSDDYLVKDKYLLRQIRCKKDGYVSIKLITSFKKVKKLTRDWQVVRSAITRNSKCIVVSKEGLRIRRRTKLSESLRKPRLLTSVLLQRIVRHVHFKNNPHSVHFSAHHRDVGDFNAVEEKVIRLPKEYNSVERVTTLFRNFGEISFVRLLRPDKEVPADLRNYATQVYDIGHTLCGVVDFENAEDALTAVRVIKHFQKQFDDEHEANTVEDGGESAQDTITNLSKYKEVLRELPPLGDLRLALLGPRVRRTLYRQDRASPQADKNTRTTSTNRERHQSNLPTRLQCPHRRGSVDNSVTSNVYEMENRLQRIFDVTNKEYSRSLPKDIGSSRSWHSHRRNAPFCVAQLKLTQRLSHVVRQPKGPDGSKGFSLPRKSTQFQL